MDEEKLKTIAAQLRQPSGEYAIEVGKKMNEGNHDINLYTIKALNLKPGDNILEIGMGNGLCLFYRVKVLFQKLYARLALHKNQYDF